jgi:hypothetical protein
MSRTRFSIGDHELQLISDGSAKERIIYDNEIVSEKRNFGLSSTHHFEVSESGKPAKYNVTFKSTFSGLLQYTVKRNDVLVKKGAISPMTGGLLRIFFFCIGVGLLCQLGYVKLISVRYPVSELTWLYINGVIELIFGIFFIILALFFRKLLVKIPKIIITVLWIRIGLMLVTSLLSFRNLLQGSNFLDYKLGIVLRIGFIWLFWFILENCKEMAKEFKLDI